jgi:hypothetical protein
LAAAFAVVVVSVAADGLISGWPSARLWARELALDAVLAVVLVFELEVV